MTDEQQMVADKIEQLRFEEPLLKIFRFKHLRPDLMEVSYPYAILALRLLETLPRNPERSVAMRKLRESKDCAVTAFLWDEE